MSGNVVRTTELLVQTASGLLVLVCLGFLAYVAVMKKRK